MKIDQNLIRWSTVQGQQSCQKWKKSKKLLKIYRVDKKLRPVAAAAAAAAYEPVQKHKVTPGIPGWLNEDLSASKYGIWLLMMSCQSVSSLGPRQDGRHFADDIFKCIFLNEHFWILNKISLKYVPWGLINNKAVLVQITAKRRTQMTSHYLKQCWCGALTRIYVTRPQWVKERLCDV